MKKYLIVCLLTFLYSCSSEESCEQYPTLTTEEANNITDKSVTLVGKIIPPTCDENITSQGFVYSKTELPKVDDNLIEKSGTNISTELENLEQNTTYYVRTFFENTEGVFYGNEIEFRTNIGDILLSLNNISNVRAESFNVSLYINSSGGGTILKKGICYSTTDNPTINDSKLELNLGNNNLSGTIDNLMFNTVYYLRGYAENESGVFYSEGLNVTTKDGVISLSTINVGNITTNSINVIGNISDDGGSKITLRGFCWNETGNPTIDNDYNQNGDDIGEFSSSVNGLESNKRYYIKTYAQNSIGVFYGNEIEFKTKSKIGDVGVGTDIDGNTFGTVVMSDDKIWMSENLQVTKFKNGDDIPQITNSSEWKTTTSPAWCYMDNNPQKTKLYNWYAVNDSRGLAPEGYRIPNENDWKQMENSLGGGYETSKKIMSPTRWLYNQDLNATNESGFTALPEGRRTWGGSFSEYNVTANWWTSTETNSGNSVSISLNGINLLGGGKLGYGEGTDKESGLSVRCFRENN